MGHISANVPESLQRLVSSLVPFSFTMRMTARANISGLPLRHLALRFAPPRTTATLSAPVMDYLFPGRLLVQPEVYAKGEDSSMASELTVSG